MGTAADSLVAHSRRFPLSALQRTLGHTVEHCIQGSVVAPCVHRRQIKGNRESRVGSRGLWVKGTVHSVPFSTVFISERAEGQTVLTNTGLVQCTVTFSQGERG